MKIYITLAGGWDKSIDEIPMPAVLMSNEVDGAIREMADFMAEDPTISDAQSDNIYPIISGGTRSTNQSKRALKLIDTMVESDYEGCPEWQEAYKELVVMLRHELDKHGRLEMMQFWDCYEGSFFGIFAKEI